MAAQGERGQEGIDLELNESMAQDEITVQDTPMQVDYPPHPNPESVMGAGAVAYDTRPLRQTSSPIPAVSATDEGGSVAPS